MAQSPATYTVKDRLTQYGDSARARLSPHFEAAGLSYPPKRIRLVGFKNEKALQLFVADSRGKWAFVRDYPILAASGQIGPKLNQGDFQVPEGFYRISFLNPNSRFHLSMRVNYPNAFDRARAADEGRNSLGGDIMIHGGAASIGCVAVGDSAIEELFTLAADTGISNIDVILSPIDFRTANLPAFETELRYDWITKLYGVLSDSLMTLPLPHPVSLTLPSVSPNPTIP
ncbi:MAG: L,D-transpeptidase family protein [Candidatus Zixiibacteriota bacterium]